MQLSKFPSGGFVIHKIPYRNGRLSAWYAGDRTLLDIEQFDSRGRATGKSPAGAASAARVIGRYADLEEAA